MRSYYLDKKKKKNGKEAVLKHRKECVKSPSRERVQITEGTLPEGHYCPNTEFTSASVKRRN